MSPGEDFCLGGNTARWQHELGAVERSKGHSLSQRMTLFQTLNNIQLLQLGVCVPPIDLQAVIIIYLGCKSELVEIIIQERWF